MTNPMIRPSCWAVGALALSWLIPLARAEQVAFVVNSNQSALTISGSFQGVAMQPQGPGGLTTKYAGTLLADINADTITFGGGSTIQALNNGNWTPLPGGAGGTAPANYGGKVYIIFVVDGKAAIRNLELDLLSDPLTLTAGAFPASGITYLPSSTSTATVDYTYSGLVGSDSGSNPLTGTLANTVSANATLAVQGAEWVLTIPVAVSGTGSDFAYQVQGQIEARAPISIPLAITDFQVGAEQLTFTIATTPGKSYEIVASTDLSSWPTVVDNFAAGTNPTIRSIARAAAPAARFFRVREVTP